MNHMLVCCANTVSAVSFNETTSEETIAMVGFDWTAPVVTTMTVLMVIMVVVAFVLCAYRHRLSCGVSEQESAPLV